MANSKENLLWEASSHGRVSEVQPLLESNPGVNVNWTVTDHKQTALHIASINNHVNVVKLLLAHPTIRVNAKTENGCTPFLLACYSGHVSLVCDAAGPSGWDHGL